MLMITPNAIQHVDNFEKKMKRIDRVLRSRKGIDWTDEFPTKVYAKFEDDPARVLEAVTYINNKEADDVIDTFLVSTMKRLLELTEEYEWHETMKFAVADYNSFLKGKVDFETLEANFRRVEHVLEHVSPKALQECRREPTSSIGNIGVELLRFVYATLCFVLDRHRPGRYRDTHCERWDTIRLARHLDRVARSTFSPEQERETQLETLRGLLGCDKT